MSQVNRSKKTYSYGAAAFRKLYGNKYSRTSDDEKYKKTYGKKLPLKEHPVWQEIDLFVRFRKDWQARRKHSSSLTQIYEEAEEKRLSALHDFLHKALMEFDADGIEGFSRVFEIAVKVDDSGSELEEDYIKVSSIWEELTLSNLHRNGFYDVFMQVPLTILDRDYNDCLPTHEEVTKGLLAEPWNELPFKSEVQLNERKKRIGNILRDLGYPCRHPPNSRHK